VGLRFRLDFSLKLSCDGKILIPWVYLYFLVVVLSLVSLGEEHNLNHWKLQYFVLFHPVPVLIFDVFMNVMSLQSSVHASENVGKYSYKKIFSIDEYRIQIES